MNDKWESDARTRSINATREGEMCAKCNVLDAKRGTEQQHVPRTRAAGSKQRISNPTATAIPRPKTTCSTEQIKLRNRLRSIKTDATHKGVIRGQHECRMRM